MSRSNKVGLVSILLFVLGVSMLLGGYAAALAGDANKVPLSTLTKCGCWSMIGGVGMLVFGAIIGIGAVGMRETEDIPPLAILGAVANCVPLICFGIGMVGLIIAAVLLNGRREHHY